MKFFNPINSFILFQLLLIGATNPVDVTEEAVVHDDEIGSSTNISLVDFQSLLYSEINYEIQQWNSQPEDRRLNGRYLSEEDVSPIAQGVWDRVVEHGWEMSRSLLNHSSPFIGHRILNQVSDTLKTAPFLICSHSTKDQSGYQRLQTLLNQIDVHLEDFFVVRNDPNKTCYHVSIDYQIAENLRSKNLTDRVDTYYTLVPMTDLMKIQYGTLDIISDDSWTVPFVHTQGDWERVLRVSLSSGHRKNLDKAKVIEMASAILNDIRSLGQTGAKNKRSRRLNREGNTKSSINSLSELFSLTSSKAKSSNGSRYLRNSNEQGSISQWIRAYELGLESDHSCSRMFEMLNINAHYDYQGFDIVLNPNIASKTKSDGIEKNVDEIESLQCKNGIECSASNKHCVTSLIMALATHPFVLSVETEGPVVTNDYEAQWITQSKHVGNRPLRNIGIDGTNQVISIIDSGVDINNEYFGPTDAKIFDVSILIGGIILC